MSEQDPNILAAELIITLINDGIDEGGPWNSDLCDLKKDDFQDYDIEKVMALLKPLFKSFLDSYERGCNEDIRFDEIDKDL